MKFEDLDFTSDEVRRKFIAETPSGRYDGHTIDGQMVIVEVSKGKSMTVKQLNSKDWFECVEYDEHGFAVSDFVEKA